MADQTKAGAADVLDPAVLATAREILFREFVELLPPESRNFGPYMHRSVYEALAERQPAALDAAERFLIVRDCAHVPSFAGMRAEFIGAALERLEARRHG